MSSFRRARFNVTGDFSGDEVKSFPELVQFNSIHNGSYAFSYHLDQKGGPLIRTSFQELSNAVHHCMADLLRLLPTVQSARLEGSRLVTSDPVAIFLESGLDLFVHIAALLWIGTPVGSLVFVARHDVLMISGGHPLSSTEPP